MYLTADSTVSNPVAAQPSNTAPAVPPPPAPQPQPPPVNQSVAVPNMAGSSTTSTVYYGQSVQQPQPQVNYPPAYYYPQPAATAANNQQPPSTPQGYPAAAAMYTYSEYTSPPPANQVPTMMHMIDYSSIETSGNSAAGQMTGHSGHAPPPPAGNAHVVSQPSGQPGGQLGVPPQQQSGHGVMSPSLTSGFSGSGDCKSTETNSILSAASYSSGALNTSHNNYNYDQYYSTSKQRNYYYPNNNYATWNYNVNYNNNYSPHHDHYTNSPGGNSTVNSETNINSKNNCNIPISNSTTNNNSSTSVFCDSCQIAFPSMAVLENHLKGSRHARRVKSQQAFRQLKDAGTLFRIRGSGTPVTELGMSSGAIRCEVCQVSVNSSHQLQAHLTGKIASSFEKRTKMKHIKVM